MMKDFWDERFSADDFVYGKAPNEFFKEQLHDLDAGCILLPLEGEGRNAVYAAASGWKVDAFDQSEAGLKKAMELAKASGVDIRYELMDVTEYQAGEHQYDAVALIYAHLPRKHRRTFHRKVCRSLKPGGRVILEAFSKEQLGKDSGGPKSVHALFDAEELKEDFSPLQIIYLQETEIELKEGAFHQGLASVVRMVAVKP